MKRVPLLISFVLLIGVAFCQAQQEGPTWEGLKKQKEKSDKNIQDPKRNVKVKTWSSRGKLYYDIYSFNTKNLYKGLKDKGGINCAEIIVGKPEKIVTEGNNETWIYPRKKLFFKGGVLDSWEETEFIDKNSLTKAANAYLKADKIDEKGKFKKSQEAKEGILKVRTALVNEGIENYKLNKYKIAYENISKSIIFFDFPRMKQDSTPKSAVHYYSGIIAHGAKMYDKSRVHFEESIKGDYEAGKSYHYYAETYAIAGDSATYIEKIKEAFDKYPDTEQIIVDLIKYYMDKYQPEKVIEYIDIAIKKNPLNASYYSAKASIYDNRSEENFTEYKQLKDEAHKEKKLAFKFRFDQKKKAEHEAKMKEADKKSESTKSIMEKNFDRAVELYDNSVGVDPKFFNPAFNLGRISYKKYERASWNSTYVYKRHKDAALADKYTNEANEALKEAALKFETAHKVKPKDRTTLSLLRSIYYKLKNTEKVDYYKDLLEKLPVEENNTGI